MDTFDDELRTLRELRKAIALELPFCLACAVGLFIASADVGRSDPSLQVLFVICLAAAGSSTAHLVPKLLGMAAFRCPRCSGRFHATRRGARTLRPGACPHCGLR